MNESTQNLVQKMLPVSIRWTTLAELAVLSVFCMILRPDALPFVSSSLSPRMRNLPQKTLWAWERPEDLRAINPETTAIAWLDQTLLLGPEVISQPRRQPLFYPSNATRIAVVRIETLPNARLDSAEEQQTVSLLLKSASRPGIAALQVDFDATRLQRRFYSGLLLSLRRQMPSSLPLSITALASWCSYDDWIAALPVDEAVPMLFRMEPDRRRASAAISEFRIREPLCTSSVGISTHEPWPEEMAGKRIYIFADRGWREDLSLLANRKLP
jgi:hypothetical protein